MAKIRTSIPSDIASDVLFASDNTCCVCRERGKSLQIHHIDENTNNNTFENLSALCLQCHDETQIRGGFGRKLSAPLITKYRDEWLERVILRRNLIDEMVIKRQVGETGLNHEIENLSHPAVQHTQLKEPPIDYINSLPWFKAALLQQAQPKWDTGVTSTMVQANYDYIDSLTGILITLANYYSPEQFGSQPVQEYFSGIISSRFQWHRTIAEPHGPGTGGTIINVTIGGSVIDDVEKMVEDMVMALVGYDDTFDRKAWPKRWRGEEI